MGSWPNTMSAPELSTNIMTRRNGEPAVLVASAGTDLLLVLVLTSLPLRAGEHRGHTNYRHTNSEVFDDVLRLGHMGPCVMVA
jgi:hypothetical protein